MPKSARKTVHEAAFALHLTSKSRGKDDNRYITISKTTRTSIFLGNRNLIAYQLSQPNPGFSTRGHTKGSKKARKLVGGGRGDLKLRDGEMVGGHAPEIASDNLGRRMLEKMGYRAGMALGAEGNKGIVAPIIAVVKTSRAGLG